MSWPTSRLYHLTPLISRPLPLSPSLGLILNHTPRPPSYLSTDPYEEIEELDLGSLSRQEAIEFLLRNHPVPTGEYYEENPKTFLSRYYPNVSDSVHSLPVTELPSEWDIWSKIELRLMAGSDWRVIHPSSLIPRGNTRKGLRGKFVTWLCDHHRRSNMFFVEDPDRFDGGHTTTAMAEDTVAICEETNRLGAAYQWSGDNGLRHVIVFIALQLAARCSPYRKHAAQALADSDPGVFELDMAKQFDVLIAQPWERLSASQPRYLEIPLVVVLDLGVLQSFREHALPLLKILDQYACRQPNPLLFVVCVGPTPSDVSFDFPVGWEHVKISLWDPDARRDEEVILRYGLQVVRHVRSDYFTDDEIWPTQDQISKVMDAVGGVMEFAGAVIAFIMEGDGISKNPKLGMERILKLISNSPLSTSAEPLRGLDHFYFRFLSQIAGPNRDEILDTISFSLLNFDEFNARVANNQRYVAHALGISQELSLRIWPVIEWTIRGNGGVVRDSFRSFIRDPQRSGEFFILLTSNSKIFGQSLAILQRSPRISMLMREMKWHPINALELANEASLHIRSSLSRLCSATRQIILREGCNDSITRQLREFDFRLFQYTCGEMPVARFSYFLGALYVAYDLLPDIVRTEPITPTDKQFIERCHRVVPPLDMQDVMDRVWRGQPYGHALLGYGDKTVLVILNDDIVASRDSFTGTDEVPMSTTGTGAVAIYTLDMLDDI